MANYSKAYKIVMKYEGGYNNDPDDRGGETYKGISRRYFPDWKGWNLIDVSKKEDGLDSQFPEGLSDIYILQVMVEQLYKDQFWNRFRGDQIENQEIATELFDSGVNMGVHQAVKFLQRSLNYLNRNGKLYRELVDDGLIGKNTFAALDVYMKNDKPEILLKLMNLLQGAHYIEVLKDYPDQEGFIRGWLDRVEISKNA